MREDLAREPEVYRAKFEVVTFHLPPEAKASLRQLRLHHWLERGRYRKQAQAIRAHWFGRLFFLADAAKLDRIADAHLKFVQVLNDYFGAGDTAETDEFCNVQEQR